MKRNINVQFSIVLTVMLFIALFVVAQPINGALTDQAKTGNYYLVQIKDGYPAAMIRDELLRSGFRVDFMEKDFMIIAALHQSRVEGMIKAVKFAVFMSGDASHLGSTPNIPRRLLQRFLRLTHPGNVRKSRQRTPAGANATVAYIEQMIRQKGLNRPGKKEHRLSERLAPDSIRKHNVHNGNIDSGKVGIQAVSGGISGRVTNSGGAGIESVFVNIYDLDQNQIGIDYTDANGDYLVEDLPAGGYKVFYDTFPAPDYLAEWYNDKGDFSGADEVVVNESSTTSGINAVLAPAGLISGRVSDESGAGIGRVGIRVFDQNENFLNHSVTDANGDYRVGSLQTGTYKVYFETWEVPGFFDEWYNDKGDFSGADEVAVTEGSTTGGIDAVLTPAGVISGRVTEIGGTGISNVDACIYDLDDNSMGLARTNADGDYRIGWLPTGTYKVLFNTYYAPNYADEWYNDKVDSGSADEVTVTEGSTTGGIDAVLAPAGFISGRVTDSVGVGIGNVGVNIWDLNYSFAGHSATDANGDYQVGCLPTGAYKVYFDNYKTPAVMGEWYDDNGDFYSADEVAVTAGGTTPGIDAVLTAEGPDWLQVTAPYGGENWEAGSVQNITWNSTGSITDVKIEFSSNNGSAWSDIVASTGNDGIYEWTVPGSPSTQCLVRISDAADNDPTDVSDVAFSISAPATFPEIALSRTSLNFAAMSGTQTQSQDLWVSNAGTGALHWSVSKTAGWFDGSPASGIGAGRIAVSVTPAGLPAATYTGTLTVSDPAAVNSPQTVAVTLKVYAAAGTDPPFGSFAVPADQAVVQSALSVSGWALDDVEVESVKLYREQGENLVYIGDAVFVDGARPDIELRYPDYPLNYRAGWGYVLMTYGLPDQGMSASYTLHAIATDKEGNHTTLGIKTIHCDNQNAVKPFGAIATPPPGGEVSGTEYSNWGWVLTPPPSMIPTDGSTIQVLVDGVPVGHPIYNIYRSDIAMHFPGYLNANGAVGLYYMDTTMYANGGHTIAWTATDNAGKADGIGSRFFSIVNTPGGSSLSTPSGAIQSTLNADCIRHYMTDPAPIRVNRNGGELRRGRDVIPDHLSGTSTNEMDALSAIAVDLNPDKKPGVHFIGYLQVGDELRRLPIGSTMDSENNIFYWQPAPGFYGAYDLVFVNANHKLLKRIRVTVR